eukprot:2255322-Lingulodinium_polyedra.AAC.1
MDEHLSGRKHRNHARGPLHAIRRLPHGSEISARTPSGLFTRAAQRGLPTMVITEVTDCSWYSQTPAFAALHPLWQALPLPLANRPNCRLHPRTLWVALACCIGTTA